MKYAFFPGCVLAQAAKEAYISTTAVAGALGIELVEIPGWTCCGASHVQDMEEMAALAINARNIALAEKMALPILTVCNTCTLMLRKAKYALDNGEKEMINEIIGKTGLEYTGTSEITHLLWVLINDYGLNRLKQKVVYPLKGIKAAGYYGCHLLRPPYLMNHEDHAKPHLLDDLIGALGGNTVDFAAKDRCCGFHAVLNAPRSVYRMTGEINLCAIEEGANCIVTPCPLCQMQLDMYQPEGKLAVKTEEDIPVLHLAQLIGLALGLSPEELGMRRHVTEAARVALFMQS
ncbi:MAG: CoB--CoM heterodisulfide reductase iron-sulfur subunit B family protein [Peptococcaceae bacterium]